MGRVKAPACILAAACGALAQTATLSLPLASALPNTTVILPLTFSSGQSPISSLQFDLQYDSYALILSATPGDAGRASGKAPYLQDVIPGLRRFLLTALNSTPVSNGVLINLFVAVNPAALPGSYYLQFSNLVAAGPGGQPITLAAGDGAVSVLPPASVLSAASLLPGPVAPGEIVTLLGVPPLASIGLKFDDTSAPILYAGPGQINAITPFALYGKTSTQLQLFERDQAVLSFDLPVAAAAPGIFTVTGAGTGPGAILNQDQSVNSPLNPAAKGSTVTLFATGAGQTDPPSVDGQITAAPFPPPAAPRDRSHWGHRSDGDLDRRRAGSGRRSAPGELRRSDSGALRPGGPDHSVRWGFQQSVRCHAGPPIGERTGKIDGRQERKAQETSYMLPDAVVGINWNASLP